MKLCPKCEHEKDEFEFNKNKSRKDGLQRICKICIQAEHKKFWKKHGHNKITQRIERNNLFKDKIRKIKEEEGCKKCKESRWWMLEFHHIDPSQKEFNIGMGVDWGQQKVFDEIKKCIILCSNCHNDFHHYKFLNKITIEQYLFGEAQRSGT